MNGRTIIKRKIVARIRIQDFSTPKIQVEGKPNQRIRKGEAVSVELPEIRNIHGNKMPTLSIDLTVNRTQDEAPLSTILFSVTEALPVYKQFWEKRKAEAETGGSFYLT